MVKDIPEWVVWSILHQLRTFLRCTMVLNSVFRMAKTHQLAICLNAASMALDSFILGHRFQPLIYLNWSGPKSIKIRYFLRSWDESSQGQLTPFIWEIITLIVILPLPPIANKTKSYLILSYQSSYLSLYLIDDYLFLTWLMATYLITDWWALITLYTAS